MEIKPQKPLDQVREAIRMKHYSYRTEHLPTVLSHQEALAVIRKMTGAPNLIARLLFCHLPSPERLRYSYGAGAFGPQGYQNHNDLHSCATAWWPGREKAAG
jgi:hypothetical protein